MHRVRVGTSGWNYEDWRGTFYPEKLPKTKWLEFYAEHFDSIEVNATFYHEMRQSTYERWRKVTPEGFCWAVKASRFITHIKRLHDVKEPLERFLGSASTLGDKLGVVLFQLPPSLAFEKGVLEEFSATLRGAGFGEAGMRSGSITLRTLPALRFAIEPRHKSWIQDEALDCLRALGFGFCVSDTGGRYPYREAVTSDFAYIRLHGPTSLYSSCYSDKELELWAQKIIAMNCDAYVYFDNDVMGYAPQNALTLKRFMKEIHGATPRSQIK
ncbi:MAG TPA: DUF72 domain-containing protein [Rectinema sp.]|nr:DUF72 domain-containing protein [Rectinema sp.]